jgi:cytidyltransferase-like protein|tara:strand:+ start:4586 stop:5374 length:789 start_codon:yes stop_codon:yes gene_type:complete
MGLYDGAISMITVVATGGFDPIHTGHINYLEDAATAGARLVVGVNSDAWLIRKKDRAFMPFEERAAIVQAMGCVDEVIAFDDSDGTAIDCLEQVKKLYPLDTIVFANGGDRTSENIPEMAVEGVEFDFGVGGTNKKNSSSWILKEWSNPTTQRKWGTYTILAQNGQWAVKELSFDVGQSLSNQRHFHRSEHWHVVSGSIMMQLDRADGVPAAKQTKLIHAGGSVDIGVGTWHKATNIGDTEAKVIEVWLGDNLSESDIERRD